MLIKPSTGQIAHIKVIGVGGGGCNAIEDMIAQGGIAGVEFIAVNTDAQALLNTKANIKVQIGDQLTRGLGSGSNPDVGSKAAEESMEKLREEIQGADLVFITAGMGGGTGTGASPIVAKIAKECGALSIAVVTKPFLFEGSKRMSAAKIGIDELKTHVDTLIVVPNQRVLQIIDQKTSMIDAFRRINSVLHQGVRGIAELITEPGLINVDFADVRTVMTEAGTALMGIGVASGDGRAVKAVQEAMSSPLLDSTINGAKGVLINISGGTDMTMLEVDEAANLVSQTVDADADIIFGATVRPELQGHIKVTLIATKFDDRFSAFRLNNDLRREASMVSTLAQAGVATQLENANLQRGVAKITSDTAEADVNLDNDPFEVPAFLRKK
ncbi:MAG: cell division protein FtsZ [bacterium]